MVYLIVIAFVIVITAFYGSSFNNELGYSRDQARILAQQMVYYHSAAAKTCASNCTGTINPTAELTTNRQGVGAFANGTFVSAVSGDYVVTYYVHRSATALRDEFEARIAATVPDYMERDTAFWAGPYDTATGRIELRSSVMWRDPITGISTPTVAEQVPIGIGAIADGAPVIVSHK